MRLSPIEHPHKPRLMARDYARTAAARHRKYPGYRLWPSARDSQLAEQMAKFLALGEQIFDIARVRRHLKRDPGHRNPIALQALDLMRVIGQQTHLTDA